jgi:dTDP-4-amino-4,6-dideoxygalactose transaminase
MIDIPYGRQSVDEDDIAAVVAVLRGDWLTQGPAVEEFEATLCSVTDAEYAVAFATGTIALHASLWAAGIGKGDTVATSPLSFVASASSALWVEAIPTFIDIDPKTLNLNLGNIGRCDALVAVHYAGLPIDLSSLVARPRVIIEDAAHALGAHTPDGPVGNCAHSDACVFSFHPVKTITTGEGGAVTTNSLELATRLRRFRSHGMVPRPEHGGWFYEISELTPNARVSDIQCALGTSQLTKLEQFVQRRNDLARSYEELLAGLDVEPAPTAPEGTRHAFHLYPVRVPKRRSVYESMRAAGIGVQVHYVPIYRHPLFAPFGTAPSDFPETERAYASLLSLPMFPGLTDKEQARVVETLARTLAIV